MFVGLEPVQTGHGGAQDCEFRNTARSVEMFNTPNPSSAVCQSTTGKPYCSFALFQMFGTLISYYFLVQQFATDEKTCSPSNSTYIMDLCNGTEIGPGNVLM